MNPEIDLDAIPVKPSRPWFLTSIGLLIMIGLLAMPFIMGEPDGEKMPDLVRFFGHFHPAILHLPIGAFALILFLEFINIFKREKPARSRLPVFFAATSAIVASALGFLLYHGGGFEGSELAETHLWAGLGFTCLAILTFIARLWSMEEGSGQLLYRLLLLLSIGVMSIASHDGASLTHGRDYLTKYAPDPVRELLGLKLKADQTKLPAKPLEEQIVYEDIVAPIFELRCYECHHADKSKGKFRMDTYELLMKGGKEGAGITPGDDLDSNIIYRMELPEDDEEHMPPEEKPNIQPHELAIIKWWVAAGADPQKTVSEHELTDEIREAIAKLDLTSVKAELAENSADQDADEDGDSEEL